MYGTETEEIREYCRYAYACVRLLESPYHVDKVYDYRIPESCRTRIKKGSFVILPYGNGNRRIIGIVIGFSNEPSCDVNRIKMIDGIAVEKLSLSEDMIALCEFMKKRYLCTFGDAVKLMLPPGALGKLRESFTVTPSGAKADIKASEVVNFEMLNYIKRHGTVTSDELNIQFPRRSRQSWRGSGRRH